MTIKKIKVVSFLCFSIVLAACSESGAGAKKADVAELEFLPEERQQAAEEPAVNQPDPGANDSSLVTPGGEVGIVVNDSTIGPKPETPVVEEVTPPVVEEAPPVDDGAPIPIGRLLNNFEKLDIAEEGFSHFEVLGNQLLYLKNETEFKRAAAGGGELLYSFSSWPTLQTLCDDFTDLLPPNVDCTDVSPHGFDIFDDRLYFIATELSPFSVDFARTDQFVDAFGPAVFTTNSKGSGSSFVKTYTDCVDIAYQESSGKLVRYEGEDGSRVLWLGKYSEFPGAMGEVSSNLTGRVAVENAQLKSCEMVDGVAQISVLDTETAGEDFDAPILAEDEVYFFKRRKSGSQRVFTELWRSRAKMTAVSFVARFGALLDDRPAVSAVAFEDKLIFALKDATPVTPDPEESADEDQGEEALAASEIDSTETDSTEDDRTEDEVSMQADSEADVGEAPPVEQLIDEQETDVEAAPVILKDDGFSLWVTNGTASGTATKIRNLRADLNPLVSITMDDVVYIAMRSDGAVVSDGLAGGDSYYLVGPNTVIQMVQSDEKVAMLSKPSLNSKGGALWISDASTRYGSRHAAHELIPIYDGLSPTPVVEFGAKNYIGAGFGKFFFPRVTSRYGCEFWVSDGTDEVLFMFKQFDISWGFPAGNLHCPSNFHVVGEVLYFTTKDHGRNRETLWRAF